MVVLSLDEFILTVMFCILLMYCLMAAQVVIDKTTAILVLRLGAVDFRYSYQVSRLILTGSMHRSAASFLDNIALHIEAVKRKIGTSVSKGIYRGSARRIYRRGIC